MKFIVLLTFLLVEYSLSSARNTRTDEPERCAAWPGYSESCCAQPTDALIKDATITDAPVPDFCCACATDAPTTSTTESTTKCPDGWMDGGHLGCFYFHYEENKVNWVEAQAACELLGGYLAEIKTEEQNNFVVSFISFINT